MNIIKLKKNNGITLIALIITIIVMLILVAVTISMAINGGLFEKAGEAVGDTKNEINKEQTLANGQITVDGKVYSSIDDYLAGREKVFSYEEIAKDENGLLKAKATYESDGYTAIIPKGFKVSEVEGETAISTGLVIKDANNNEFVWIPVTEEIGASYSYDNNYYSEPIELTDNYSNSGAAYDSQTTLDYLYGTNYYNYERDFKYADEYAEMVKSVNENNGFYIGRYETTIDDNGKIGSKYNTTVLTAGTTLFTKDSYNYPYKWYGLYYVSKNANVTGNGEDVQTAMIYGVLWDKTMDFIRDQKAAEKTTYDVDNSTHSWHKGPWIGTGSASGQANPNTVDSYGNIIFGDVALNIWDLESNARGNNPRSLFFW